MTHESIQLVRPTLDLEAAYLAMVEDFVDNTSPGGYAMPSLKPDELPGYVAKIRSYEQSEGLPDGYVQQTTFWLVRDGDYIIGEVRLRHTLTPNLEQEGGHIGYAIRPAERRRGYGTLILDMVLEEARKIGLKRALLTCDPDNTASARIIVKNGGVQDTDGVAPGTGHPESRYWIEL